MKGVSRSAGRLKHEYEAKLWDLDHRFHGAALGGEDEVPPQPGPLITRFSDKGGLDQSCLLAGPFGDISLHFSTESRAANLSRVQWFDQRAYFVLPSISSSPFNLLTRVHSQNCFKFFLLLEFVRHLTLSCLFFYIGHAESTYRYSTFHVEVSQPIVVNKWDGRTSF